jgi:hypothetical protein
MRFHPGICQPDLVLSASLNLGHVRAAAATAAATEVDSRRPGHEHGDDDRGHVSSPAEPQESH